MELLETLLSIYNIGLGCGVFTIDKIISFCDKVIEKLDNPPYEIIEVALMSKAKIDDIENKLYKFNGYSEINKSEIVKIILSVIHKKYMNNEFDIVKAIKCTDALLIHTRLSYDNEYCDLYGIDDCYYLAKSGICGNLN